MIPWWWLCIALPLGFVCGAFWLAYCIGADNWAGDDETDPG